MSEVPNYKITLSNDNGPRFQDPEGTGLMVPGSRILAESGPRILTVPTTHGPAYRDKMYLTVVRAVGNLHRFDFPDSVTCLCISVRSPYDLHARPLSAEMFPLETNCPIPVPVLPE